jgi:uncharacterized protein (TIRG00374 family)
VPYVLRDFASRLRRHWLVAVGLGAVAGLIVAVEPSKVARVLTGADPVALALMLPCVLLLYVVHGAAWWVALRGVGAPITFRRAIAVTYISQAFVFLPGGDLWRVPVVKDESAALVEAGAIAGTVVFDDLVFLFVLTFAMVPAVWRTPLLMLPLLALLLPQVAIFAILLWPRLYEWLSARVGRVGPARRFEPQLQMLGSSFRRLVTVRTIVPVVLLDLVCVALAVALFGLALIAAHAGGVGPQQVAFTYALGQVSAGLTVLPAALGAYEGMMTGLMAVQGVAPAAAAVAALLYRAFNDVLMALIGLAVAVTSERLRHGARVAPAESRPGAEAERLHIDDREPLGSSTPPPASARRVAARRPTPPGGRA